MYQCLQCSATRPVPNVRNLYTHHTATLRILKTLSCHVTISLSRLRIPLLRRQKSVDKTSPDFQMSQRRDFVQCLYIKLCTSTFPTWVWRQASLLFPKRIFRCPFLLKDKIEFICCPLCLSKKTPFPFFSCSHALRRSS